MHEPRFQPVAAILALILPGLGYVALGQIRRALYVGGAILGLIAGGLLVGGIDSIDSKEDPLWFGVQALAGPTTFGLDYLHQNHFKITNAAGKKITPLPGSGAKGGASAPSPRKGLSRINDVGMLYVALAGMLNLIAIIDCTWHGHGHGSSSTHRKPKQRPVHDQRVRIRRGGGGS